MDDERLAATLGQASRARRPNEVAAWLNVGADEKAESVIRLAPKGTKTVIDIGCGAGSVLAALDRRAFGERYWACEPSSALVDQIPSISRLVSVEVSTLDSAFPDLVFDLAILSHVVEHVRAPAVLIAQALHRAKHVIVEVPIEGGLLTRVRTRGRDLADGHPSGHVHFFSQAEARKLIGVAGGTLLAEHPYFPISPYRMAANRPSQRVVLAVASRAEGLARLHYAHFAMLATTRTFPAWDHHYPSP